MTATRRIVLNVLATYGRSVFVLFVGLFTSRWVLRALGKTDLGLFALVGSTIAFVAVFNNVLGLAASRFFAYAIGKSGTKDWHEESEDVQRWFNAALSIHLVMPVVLIAMGYPFGAYAIRHWFVIPPERIGACLWVFRLSMASLFCTVASVPFISMYKAHQLISELAFWGVFQALLLLGLVYRLLFVQGDRLVCYSMMLVIPGIAVQLAQMFRAWRTFGACRVRPSMMFDRARILPLFRYAFWELFSCGGDIARKNGTAFIINRFFGPAMNASYSITLHVSAHTGTFTSALLGAMAPAVTTAEGAKNSGSAVALAFRSGKFAVLLTALFAIPLVVEIDEVLRIWLETPPDGTATLCRCLLCALICHKLGIGQHLMVAAKGRIGLFNFVLGITSLSTLVFVYAFVKAGWGPLGIGLSFVISYSLLSLERAVFGWRLCGMSLRHWCFRIVIPLLAVVVLAFLAGFAVQGAASASVWRLLAVGVTTTAVLAAGAVLFVLDGGERRFAATRLCRLFGARRTAS